MRVLDIESELVSSLTDVRKLATIFEKGIRPEHFVDPVNASAVGWAIDYYETSGQAKAPTKAALASEFKSLEIVEPEESISWLCEEIKKRYLSGNIQSTLLEVSEKVHDDPTGVMEHLFSKLWSFSYSTEERSGKSILSGSIEQRKKRLEERRKASENKEIVGARIGLQEVDELTGGLLDGELASIAGFAKAGKTWIGLNAAKVNSENGRKVLFITLELSVEEVEDRLDALFSGVSYARLQQGVISKKETADLEDAYEKMKSFGQVYIEQPAPGKRTVKQIVMRARELDVDVIIVDQLSFVESIGGETPDDFRGMRKIVIELKNEISRPDEKQFPCFLLAQMNRESKGTRHGRGDMSTLAGTSELERASNIVYGISKSRQEAINNVSTFEILGSRRTDVKAWVIKSQLRDNTEFSVIRERQDDEE